LNAEDFVEALLFAAVPLDVAKIIRSRFRLSVLLSTVRPLVGIYLALCTENQLPSWRIREHVLEGSTLGACDCVFRRMELSFLRKVKTGFYLRLLDKELRASTTKKLLASSRDRAECGGPS